MALDTKIESLLFLSGRPMSTRELADLAKCEAKEVEEAGDRLLAKYREAGAGIQFLKNGASYQMVTSPENASLVQEFVKEEMTGELTRPSLETLTIIAYRGPVSKTDLDRIRGVNCSMIVHNLLIRGLIDARDDKKKDEVYYTVTFDFLKFLGLNEVKELPDYERLSKDDTIDKILGESSPQNSNPAAPTEEPGEEKDETEGEEEDEESDEDEDFEDEEGEDDSGEDDAGEEKKEEDQ